VVRDVLIYPDPLLKQPAARVDGIDDTIRAVAEDLLDTMAAHNRCVGIAAPQIGVLVRMIVVDVSSHPKAEQHHGRLLLINPRVTEFDGQAIGREGCLSLPEITANVKRAERITVEAICLEEKPLTFSASGFEARALLHEIDHLEGILILDRAAAPSEIFPRVKTAKKKSES